MPAAALFEALLVIPTGIMKRFISLTKLCWHVIALWALCEVPARARDYGLSLIQLAPPQRTTFSDQVFVMQVLPAFCSMIQLHRNRACLVILCQSWTFFANTIRQRIQMVWKEANFVFESVHCSKFQLPHHRDTYLFVPKIFYSPFSKQSSSGVAFLLLNV